MKIDLIPYIEKAQKRFTELENALADPSVFNNPQKMSELSKEYTRLRELVEVGSQYQKTVKELEENKKLIESAQTDPELKEMARRKYRVWKKKKRHCMTRS